jgi:protein CWC15
MTTAHRPTWKAAVGRAQEGGWSAGGKVSTSSSVRDLASHTKLKFRKGTQLASTDQRSALLAESLAKMEEAERSAELTAKRYVKMGRERLLALEDGEEERGKMLLLKQTADVDEEKIKQKYDDEDLDDEGGGGGRWSDIDDNNNLESDASDLDASDDDLDSDDEDEEAALQAELTKIRAERAATKAKEEAETAAEERAQMEEAALTGNPLLNSDGASGRVKRRWNDDVVFRNQAKGEPDQNKKRFINDTVRNDFHKRFLNKFIK